MILFFWGRSLAGNWAGVRAFSWRVRWSWLVGSLTVLLVHQPFLALAWQRIAAELGELLSLPQALRIYLTAQIARYVPGGVWDVAGRVYLAGEAGYSRTRISVSILLEMVLHVVSAALFFLLTLPFWPDTAAVRPFAIALAVMAVGGLIGLHPAVLRPALLRLGRLTGRDVSLSRRLPFPALLRLLGYQMVARLLVGAAFATFTLGVYALPAVEAPRLAGVFVAGWLVGFLVVIMPMGLGVREGAIAWLLTSVMPLPAATAVAVGFRILIALRDLVLAGLGARLGGDWRR